MRSESLLDIVHRERVMAAMGRRGRRSKSKALAYTPMRVAYTYANTMRFAQQWDSPVTGNRRLLNDWNHLSIECLARNAVYIREKGRALALRVSEHLLSKWIADQPTWKA